MKIEQIVIEVFRSLRHNFEMLQSQEGLSLILIRIEFGKRDSSLECIHDLTAVPRHFALSVQLLVVVSRVFVYLFRFHFKRLFALG